MRSSRSVAAAAVLGLVAVLCYLEPCESSCWSDVKSSHRLKKLSRRTQTKLAAMANATEFRTVLEPLLVVRPAGSEANIRVRNYIVSYMRALGWSVDEDAFEQRTVIGNVSFTNVIATQNPRVRRRLVLACHFDSKLFTEFEFIGATDSAVPCAMLLHLARLLNASLWRDSTGEGEDVSLQLVFFDGEEAFREWTHHDSTYGSRHLAEQWASTKHALDNNSTVLDGIDVLLLLDLIGSGRSVFYNYFDETALLYFKLQETELLLRSRNLLPRDGSSFFSSQRPFSGIEDDHLPFHNRGVRIVHLIPMRFPAVWHKAGDNADALDFGVIEELSTILRTFVAQYLHLSV